MQLIFLHGGAASGKLTTAQALHDLVGYPIFHNHLVVDALTAVFPSAIDQHGGQVLFVRLNVSPEEQEKRVVAESRRAFHKLTDVTVLRRLREHQQHVEQPPTDFEVDTDTSTAEQTAAHIVERFRLQPQPVLERYPTIHRQSR